MGLFRSLAGTICLELTSADVAGSLRNINELGIVISDVQTSGDLTVSFSVPRQSLHPIEKMAARKGERLRVLQRSGLFWSLWALRYRPVLLFGMSLLLVLALYTPSRVLFVEVEGNEQLPRQLILEAAQDAGIQFGASRRAVRSEKMKNTLLGAVPQLQWAGVNTYGCVAVISVRERAQPIKPQESASVTQIVASSDGVITSCTVTGGSALCSPGQAVQKGQVLISGYVDCGQTITATRAEGEIFALTNHDLSLVIPSKSLVRDQQGGSKTNFSLQIGKKRINFYNGSGISDATCVKMYSEYYITLPGGYRLPVKLIKEQIHHYDTQTKLRGEESARAFLSESGLDYLRRHFVALEVLNVQEAFLLDGDCYRLNGQYACSEMIGRQQGEQIGDFHGKTD